MALARGPVLAPGLGALLSSSRRLGPLGAATVLHLSLGLDGRHTEALDGLLDQGQTVPTAEYDNRFGPDPGLVAATEKWLRAGGLEASWSPGDAVLEVQGPAAAVEKAFSVSLGRYRTAGGGGQQLTFYAPGGRPTLPTGAGKVVTSVLGLDDYPALATPRPGLAGPGRRAGRTARAPPTPRPSAASPPTRCPGFTTSAPSTREG